MRRPAAWAASAILAATVIVGCGGGGDDSDEFCATAEDIQSAQDTGDMTEEDIQDTLSDLVDSAPDEIKDDLEVIQDALDDPTSADTAELDEAGTNLESYVKDECDIDISG